MSDTDLQIKIVLNPSARLRLSALAAVQPLTKYSTEAVIDAELDKVLANQLVWKNTATAKIMIRVCQRALAVPQFYPEEINHADLSPDDVNCIGSVFRYLGGKKAGIIERGATFKRSEAEGRKGSTVFAYGVKNRALAAALIRRLGGRVAEPQLQLL